MNAEVNSYNIYVFERPKAEVYIAHYIDKVAWILGIILFIVTQFDTQYKLSNWHVFFLTILFFSLLLEFYRRRFAYRMSFNLNTNEVTFTLFRKNGSFTVKMEDINEIRMNAYITFILDKRKVYYNDLVNKELVPFIEKLRPTTWSKLGRFLYKHW